MADETTPKSDQDSNVRGANILDLVLFSDEWVHRRVDTLTLAKDGESLRSVSLDITVPEYLAVFGTQGQNADQDRVLVPLAFIRKASLRNLSTTGPSKHPFSILEKRRNSAVAKEMLTAAIPENWLKGQAGTEIYEVIDDAVKFDPTTQGPRPSDELKERLSLTSVNEDLFHLQTIVDLARTLEDHFLLIGELDSTVLGRRSIIKFSYEHELSIQQHWDYAIAFRYDPPDFGFAASEHVEIVVPSDLAIRLVSFREVSGEGDVPADVDAPNLERSRAHVSLTPSDRFASATVAVEVTPSSRGILPFTAMSVTAAASLTALALVERFVLPSSLSIIDHGVALASPAVSILLVGPALFLSWLARAPEHDVVARLLGPLRMCLVMCAAVFLGLGVLMAVPLTVAAKQVAWTLVAGTAVVATIWFLSFTLSLHRRGLAVVDWLNKKRQEKVARSS